MARRASHGAGGASRDPPAPRRAAAHCVEATRVGGGGGRCSAPCRRGKHRPGDASPTAMAVARTTARGPQRVAIPP